MIGFPDIIFFVGSHSTGKSHTLRELGLRYLLGERSAGSYFIDGIPRDLQVISPSYMSLSEIPNEAQQYAILFEYLRKLGQISEQLLTSVVYATNCAMRFLGYAYADKLNNECVEVLKSVAKFENEIAHTVFYFPIEVPIVKDGQRPGSTEFQKEVALGILHYLEELDINYRIVSGPIQHKVERIAGILDLASLY